MLRIFKGVYIVFGDEDNLHCVKLRNGFEAKDLGRVVVFRAWSEKEAMAFARSRFGMINPKPKLVK